MMKYEPVKNLSLAEINNIVSAKHIDINTIPAVLSAIYYHDTIYAGDILYKCITSASGIDKLYFFRIIPTLMQIHKTSYLAPLFEAELKKEHFSLKAHKTEIAKLINEVSEFKELYSKRCSG